MYLTEMKPTLIPRRLQIVIVKTSGLQSNCSGTCYMYAYCVWRGVVKFGSKQDFWIFTVGEGDFGGRKVP